MWVCMSMRKRAAAEGVREGGREEREDEVDERHAEGAMVTQCGACWTSQYGFEAILYRGCRPRLTESLHQGNLASSTLG